MGKEERTREEYICMIHDLLEAVDEKQRLIFYFVFISEIEKKEKGVA